MRLFVTGADAHMVLSTVEDFCGECDVSCRAVGPLEKFLNTPKNDSPNAQLVTSIGATMAELTTAVSYEQSVGYREHVLVACNMPLMRSVCLDGDMTMFPFALYERGTAIEREVWDACGYVLRNVYGNVPFDYVFRVGGLLPEEKLLRDMSVLRGGQQIVDVNRSSEMVDIVNYELHQTS